MKNIIPSLCLGIILMLALISGISCKIKDHYIDMPDRCLLPMDFGYCRAKMKRFYFNSNRNQCSVFYFGGCAGNENNFETLEECEEVCGNKEFAGLE